MIQGLLLTADTTCCNLKDIYKVLDYFWCNDHNKHRVYSKQEISNDLCDGRQDVSSEVRVKFLPLFCLRVEYGELLIMSADGRWDLNQCLKG
jgi:hypothetical protein